MERVLVLFRKGPYGLINSLEGVRVCQGLLVLDVETDAIFLDDGVFNLVKNQQPEGIGHHSVMGALEALHKYDVPIFACVKSMQERGLTTDDFDPKLEVKVLTIEQISDLLIEAETTIAL